MTYIPKTKEWFLERIGKRIYRDKSSCPCQVCLEVFKNGLVIADEQHADYLFLIDGDLDSEAFNYRDEK